MRNKLIGDRPGLAGSVVTVPRHVVYRRFPTETVVLNLETGRYHGLNVVGGEMLDVLQRSSSLGAAVAELAECYEQPPQVLEADLEALCAKLLERGLIELRDPQPLRARAESPA